ncbi:HPr family phosphocarrier protein [Acetivibrio saccincola]|jgi:phosphocarrier protein|uniref:Phosphocarrier protein HPr n=1 Tax=Acetivibrio saccincola TaxID=1677857 RepID=A0A2K9EK15_9FIRM|nr:HPr family phosphocarrier protein [Acetivibrio saccincola]AUG58333.1 HPr-like protein Crh [Acetivibrio saccincola]PQQ65356.1 phosphocarrier protein HPr [Acetivibrio saccincola]PQQ68209.1 phosphocarrier protein HPr [Acetivibrio saccincola]PQQ68415.1 phosphocarrier protein HPr [Acetivibrio saccincola]
MVEKTVKIINPSGLHARPAALFVQTAGKYTSEIWIKHGGKKVNAKSIMGLMSLAISKGTSIVIGAEGEDEEIAIKELEDLIISGLGE